VLAAGAYIDPAAGAHHEGEGGDMDEHDDLDDAGPGGEEAGSGDDASGPDAPGEMAEPHGTHPAAERDPGPPPRDEAPDRAPFSLFSWIRRDPAPRPAAPPETDPGPGPGKPDPLE
jgi:hypothetical protein